MLPWLCDQSNTPGMQNLRRNKVEAHSVARELVDSKREELRAGTPRKDLMSMLGSSPLAPLPLLAWLLRAFFTQSKQMILSAKA